MKYQMPYYYTKKTFCSHLRRAHTLIKTFIIDLRKPVPFEAYSKPVSAGTGTYHSSVTRLFLQVSAWSCSEMDHNNRSEQVASCGVLHSCFLFLVHTLPRFRAHVSRVRYNNNMAIGAPPWLRCP
jgi:hypothetical protein